MRLSLVVNRRTYPLISAVILGAVFLTVPAVSYAQTAADQIVAQTNTAQPADREAILKSIQAALQQPADKKEDSSLNPFKKEEPKPVYLGDVLDRNSDAYKVEKLAGQAKNQGFYGADTAKGKQEDNLLFSPPPEMESLQSINTAQGGTGNAISDDPVNKEISLDMRRDAQKEAALSYGARGGLAKRNYQIMERMQDFETVLDQVFNFRALLVKAPSGLLIEPPIIKEAADALIINEGGEEAAVSEKVFNINKKAKIVSAPRDWRHYVLQSWTDLPPPPRVLWPKTPKEQADWSTWVRQGWNAGFEQAEQIFESNVNRLVADYNGMVRYRMLLAQGMISQPYAMQEDRGVTGGKNVMRVGDRALRITGPSQFMTGSDLWKPADR